jgi:hypothetical protein
MKNKESILEWFHHNYGGNGGRIELSALLDEFIESIQAQEHLTCEPVCPKCGNYSNGSPPCICYNNKKILSENDATRIITAFVIGITWNTELTSLEVYNKIDQLKIELGFAEQRIKAQPIAEIEAELKADGVDVDKFKERIKETVKNAIEKREADEIKNDIKKTNRRAER